MMRRARTLIAIAAASLAAGGCLVRPGARGAPAARVWPMTLTAAQESAQAGRPGDAVKALEEFAARYSGSTEATESLYWRALLLLDPSNRDGTPKAAVAALDLYLSSTTPIAHRMEAQSLRRTAARLDGLASAVAAATAAVRASENAGKDANESSDRASDRVNELANAVKSRDAEIQRLRDDLAKADDELARIKKRLAAPTKP